MDKATLREEILSHISLPVIRGREVSAAAYGIYPDSGENLRCARQAAIDDSQILLTATQRGDKPIIYSEMLHKGMLGIPLESTAWEGKTYTRFADRFVCDDWNLVQTYLRDGKYTDGLPDEYCLLGDIINGTVPGRESEDEFVITSSHGIALSDVAVAEMILRKADEKGAGQILTLMEEEDILR